MRRKLLDTDIFSEVLKGIDPRVAARAAAYKADCGRYTISTITVMEIVKGFRKVEREEISPRSRLPGPRRRNCRFAPG